MKPRILFVAENVTLAQVVRLCVLAESLDPARYEVHFASSSFDPMLFSEQTFELHELYTMSKGSIEAALASGKRLYEKGTLFDYVKADLELIDRVRPALIVGDFRLSLSISAPVSRVPHATLINAYWSPYRSEQSFPVPDHPIVRLLGEDLSERYFPQAIPRVFKHFAAPVNAVRRRYGLGEIGSLQDVLVHGDYTLYADTPALVPTDNLPANHGYLGPVLWSPNVGFDERQLGDADARPLVYVTLGSSGKAEVLPTLVSALAEMPVRVILASAGRADLTQLPANVAAFSFVPGELVARHARLVISNGGSTTGYQALSQGTPVLGIPANFDQFLATQAIERRGAGLSVKARSLNVEQVQHAVWRLLTDPQFSVNAAAVAADFAEFRARERFPRFVDHVVVAQPAHAEHACG